MTTPHQTIEQVSGNSPSLAKMLGPGAFQLGGGSYNFGQDMTEHIARVLVKGPGVTLANAFTNLPAFLTALGNYLKTLPLEALQVFRDFIPDALENAFDNIEGAVETIINALGLANLKMTLYHFEQWIEEAFNGVKDKAEQAIQNFTDTINAIGGTVWHDVLSLLENLKDLLDGLLAGDLGGTIAGIVSAIQGAADGVVAWLTGFGKSAISDVVLLLQGKTQHLGDIDGLYDAAQGFFNRSSSVLKFLGTGGDLGKFDVSGLLGTIPTGNIPDITKAMSTDLAIAADNVQGAIDSFLNGLKNTAGAAGQAFEDIEDAAASLVTSLYNRLGAHAATRASIDNVDTAALTMAKTVSDNTTAINNLQNMLKSSNGLSAQWTFRQPETQLLTTSGPPTQPTWFTLNQDFLDTIVLPGGAGGDGAGVGSTNGGTGGSSSITVVDGAGSHTLTATGATRGSVLAGQPVAPINYLDLPYHGGGGQSTPGQPGHTPGGGGAAGNGLGKVGGNAGVFASASYKPTSWPTTATVGAGGGGGSGLGGAGGSGARGQIWAVSRPAVPSVFTLAGVSLGSIPLLRYNADVAQTDAQTVGAVWNRSQASGNVLILRANSAFTTYVYLKLSSNGTGGTDYELGYVSGGTQHAWKTGSVASALPLNAWSLSVDTGYIFTISVMGAGIDSYTDGSHASSLGSTFRCGGFGTSDATTPGSIASWAFLDTGTPSTITQSDVATLEGSTSSSYGNLATPGPSVTIDVPQSGVVVVDVQAQFSVAPGVSAAMAFSLSGANTRAAQDAEAAQVSVNSEATPTDLPTLARRTVLTGLNPGTTTFLAQYERPSGSGTCNFQNRRIIADPRP